MPPTSSKSTRQRENLKSRVYAKGSEMIPCTACEKKSSREGEPVKCIKSEGATRCAECVHRGLSRCDAGGPLPSEWVSLDKAKERLEEEYDAAEAAYLAFITAHRAKLARIRKHRQFLKAREAEMLRRGLATLDELDAVENEEKEENEREAQQAPREALAASASSPLSWPSGWSPDPVLAYHFSGPYPEGFGFGGGTPQANQCT